MPDWYWDVKSKEAPPTESGIPLDDLYDGLNSIGETFTAASEDSRPTDEPASK